MTLRSTLFVAVLSGLCLGAGFVVPALWSVSFIGVGLFLHTTATARSLPSAAKAGVVAWTVKAALSVGWFFSVYPLTWLGFDGGLGQLLVITFYWLTIALVLGVAGGLVAVVAYQLRRRQTQWLLVLFPAVWLGGEVLGSLLFSLFNLGPGSGINLFFSMSYGGYHLAQSALLLPFAKLAGVYGLSVVLAAAGTLLYWLYRHQTKPLLAFIVFAFIAATGLLPSPSSLIDDARKTALVASIDTRFENSLLQTEAGATQRQQQLYAAVAAATAAGARYVVLPEDARLFDTSVSPTLAASLFQFTAGKSNAIIIDSGKVTHASTSHLSAFVLDQTANEIYQPQKHYLVPQGEYLPYGYGAFLRLAGLGELAARYNAERAFTSGNPFVAAPAHIPGVLFCFEVLSPVGVRRLMSNRSETPFIVHPISHSWFHTPTTLWQQLDSMLRVQSVWNNQVIVSAANQATGKVYWPTGAITVPAVVASGEAWQLKLVQVPVPPASLQPTE